MSAHTTPLPPPTPDIYATARQLARPVARGWMPRAHANGALIHAALAAAGDWDKALQGARFAQWVLGQEVRRQQIVRQLTEHRIRRLTWKMLLAGRAMNAVLAECHGINGDAAFPLTEPEVTAVVRDAEQGVRRHG